MFGIDVSEFQGVIDWDTVKDQIKFAILRIGWIANRENRIDSKFERNYNECKRLGIPVGVYAYCYSASEEAARNGANWVITNLKDKTLELPVFIDMEDKSIANLGKDKLTNICIAFNSIIENAGFKAGVYANRNWFDNYLNKNILKSKYTTWIAHYGLRSDNAYQGEYDMWQNSSGGKINGITGSHVDTNIMYTDLIAGEKMDRPVPSDKPSNEEIAREVLDGKWGNGQDRVKRLTDAGYDYSEIQKIVNQLAK